MKCNKLGSFKEPSLRNQTAFGSPAEHAGQLKETRMGPEFAPRKSPRKECAQNLNEEFFLDATQKVFDDTIEDSEFELGAPDADLTTMDLQRTPKKIKAPVFESPQKKKQRSDHLRDLVQNKSILSVVQAEPKPPRIFRSKSPVPSKLRVRGRLFVSRSRILQIKKNLHQTKLQRTINKPGRRFRVKPLQSRQIKREFLRKRRRDKGETGEAEGDVKCWACGRLLHCSQDLLNFKFFTKTGDPNRVRLNDIFSARGELCPKCQKKHGAQGQSNPGAKNPFFGRGAQVYANSNDNEDSRSASDLSADSSLSEISLKNSQIKKVLQFKGDKKNRVAQRSFKNVGASQFICSSRRGTKYFACYRKEEEKLVFAEEVDRAKLHPMRDDEDYDTDEEVIEKHLERVTSTFFRGLRKVCRRRSKAAAFN